MNHDKEIEQLKIELQKILIDFNVDVDDLSNHQIRVDCKQKMDKAYHWATKLINVLIDTNDYTKFFCKVRENVEKLQS